MSSSPEVDTDAIVNVIGLHRAYGSHVVIENLNLSVGEGEFVALLGESGCGKTTLLRVLAGLDPPDAGDVSVPQPLAVVFQEPRLFPWRRVWKNVITGVPDKRGGRELARRALGEVGLTDHLGAWPATLSGGQAQRVALARALVREPKLLLLDEPFAALDALTRLKMQALVIDLCSRHRPATVLVTHDVDEALSLADRVAVMRQGRIELVLQVGLPEPRDRDAPRFRELRRLLLGELGVDV